RKFSQIPAIDIVAAGIGLVIGGVVSSLLALPASLLPNPYGQWVPLLVALVACSLSVFVVVRRKQDLTNLIFRRRAPGPAEELLLDTSVTIDGRIGGLVRTGIVTVTRTVPGFLLRELQGIADSPDPSRKVRGRRGLDTLERLRREEFAELDFIEVDVDE